MPRACRATSDALESMRMRRRRGMWRLHLHVGAAKGKRRRWGAEQEKMRGRPLIIQVGTGRVRNKMPKSRLQRGVSSTAGLKTAMYC